MPSGNLIAAAGGGQRVFGEGTSMLVKDAETMLHSLHHAFQHVSVCDNLQGMWAVSALLRLPW